MCRDAWLRLIQPLIAQVPMLATIGEPLKPFEAPLLQ